MIDKTTLIDNLDNLYLAMGLPIYLLDKERYILHQCRSFYQVPRNLIHDILMNMNVFHSKIDAFKKHQEMYFLIPYHDKDIHSLCIGPILLRKIPRNANYSTIEFYNQMIKKPDTTDFLDKIGYFGNEMIPKIKFLYHLLNDDKLTVEEVTQSFSKKGQNWTHSYLSTHLYHEREEEKAYSYMDQQKFLHYLSLGDSITARMYASKIIAGRMGSMSEDEIRRFKYAFVAGVSLMTHTSIKCNVPVGKAYTLSDVFIKKADESYSAEDLTVLYYQCTQEFCDLVKTYKQNKQYPLWVRNCMEYIDKNLHSPISLEDLGRVVHMAPAYISVQFKSITSQSLKDFINQQKITEAQYLLRHTAMSIQEISLVLQYSSQSYFAKIFLRYAGVLPKEYRMNIM